MVTGQGEGHCEVVIITDRVHIKVSIVTDQSERTDITMCCN